MVLHPTGFSVPCRLRFTRCALTAPFHHHPPTLGEQRQAVCFLWHYPSVRLLAYRPCVSQSYGLELHGVVPCGVRTFLPRLAPEAILRPSKTTTTIPSSQTHLKSGDCPQLARCLLSSRLPAPLPLGLLISCRDNSAFFLCSLDTRGIGARVVLAGMDAIG